jgi:SMC interacting uncharacterized protein involved in chromosome segregation
MSTISSQDDRRLKQFIHKVEIDLLEVGKVLKTRNYNLSAIKKKLAKNTDPADPLAQNIATVEENIKSLAKVFNIRYNIADIEPFFLSLRKKLNPPRQTLITDWFETIVNNELKNGKK